MVSEFNRRDALGPEERLLIAMADRSEDHPGGISNHDRDPTLRAVQDALESLQDAVLHARSQQRYMAAESLDAIVRVVAVQATHLTIESSESA